MLQAANLQHEAGRLLNSGKKQEGGEDGTPLRLAPKAFVNAASIAWVAQADERG